MKHAYFVADLNGNPVRIEKHQMLQGANRCSCSLMTVSLPPDWANVTTVIVNLQIVSNEGNGLYHSEFISIPVRLEERIDK